MFTKAELSSLLSKEDCSLLSKELNSRFDAVDFKAVEGSKYGDIYLVAEVKYKGIFLAITITYDKYFFNDFESLPDNRFKRLQRVIDIFKEEIEFFEYYAVGCFDMDDDLLLSYFDIDYLTYSIVYMYDDFNNQELVNSIKIFIENVLGRQYFVNYIDFHNYVVKYFPKICPLEIKSKI